MIQTFKVTKEILQKAVDACHNGTIAQNCAIAQAIKIVYPNVAVGYSYVYNGMVPIAEVPNKVKAYMYRFDGTAHDNQHKLPEFEFTLDITDPVNQ